ncbi:MAG: DEAD/DEAH box helicase [Deltaproteobacteria bacterium]|nr:MAG: DEAD/DEAH box helicase [Deltaproteobacteria bacterium]
MEQSTIVEVLSDGARALGVGTRVAAAAERLVASGRISRPDVGARRVAAYVSDERAGRVRARIEWVRGDLRTACSCGRSNGKPCRHTAALAMLLAGHALPPAAGEDRDESLEQRQIRRRRERGRSGLFTVAAERGAAGAFGRYRVSSPSERTYDVVIRAVDAHHNSCTCEDLRTNRLGTCKHIEAVLAWLERGRRRAWLRAARQVGCAHSYLYVDAASEQVGLRVAAGARRAGRVRDRWFGANGRLERPLAAVWPELHAAARAAGIEVPDEVRAFAERAMDVAARDERWREVEAQVRRAGAEQPGFAGRLYPYQVDGVAFLVSRGRALLADDMGLGKTAQAIAAMARMFRDGQVARALVVCPASLKHQWAQEIARFTAGPRQLTTTVVSGGRRARAAMYRGAGQVVIVNYELVRTDRASIAALGADLLVLDEAQRIKNWRTKTAEAVKQLDTAYAFVLTGTPLENRLDDLYSLMQVIDPHVLGPLWCFNRDFMLLDDRGKPAGYRNLAELRARLRSHVLRRRKQDVLDQLPDLVTVRRSVPLGAAQRDVHDEAQARVARLLARLKKRPLTPAEEKQLLSAFQRMRMACNAAELVGERPPRGGSPKLVELERLLEELCIDGGHKVIVFSEWEHMQRLAAGVAERLGIGYVRLHGGVPSGQRGALVDRFNDDPNCHVFLSTDAGGVGLNLQAASHIINLDLPWNPAVLAQRIGRAHRLGQASSVHVVLLVGEDCVEQRMEHTLAGKRALFEAAIGDDSATDELGRTSLAGRVATLLEESYAAQTGRQDAVAGRAPAERAPAEDAVVDAVRERVGDALQRVLETRDGRIVAVVADGAASRGDVGGAIVVPASAAQSLASFGEGSPLAGAVVRYEAPACEDPEVPRRREQAAAAARKLDAARALVAAGLGGEALAMLHASLALACRAAAARDPGDAPDALLAAVYGELIPAERLRTSDAHALSRAGDLARAFAASPASPPDAVVRELIGDAADLVARLHGHLAPGESAQAAERQAATP